MNPLSLKRSYMAHVWQEGYHTVLPPTLIWAIPAFTLHPQGVASLAGTHRTYPRRDYCQAELTRVAGYIPR